MDARYRLTELPLDTPDADPRWRGYLDATALGFLQSYRKPESLAPFIRFAREDGHRLRVVEADDAGPADLPIATFASFDREVNVGGGRQLRADLISDVTVRSSHRRRGILRALMTADLTEAKQRGIALASLTASEGTIYGRFGFGVATRTASVEIDARRFALRADVPGHVEMVRPADLGEAYDRVTAAYQASVRGSHRWLSWHRLMSTGGWDFEAQGPSDKLRAIVHYGEDGAPDGFATYVVPGWDEPMTLEVWDVVAADPRAQLALWQFLASIDLVDRLQGRRLGVDSPVFWASVDQRAVKLTALRDHIWLRVLDVPAALGARGYDAEGEVVLAVEDPMGLAAGTWRVRAAGGSAEVDATDDAPEVTLDVEALGSLYLGGVGLRALADAGRARGSEAALAAAGRLFATLDEPRCLTFF